MEGVLSRIKSCRRCIRPASLNRKDGYCSSKCKKLDRWEYIQWGWRNAIAPAKVD